MLYYHFAVNCATAPAEPAYLRESCRSGARRDAFRTEGQIRTDLGMNYSHRVGRGSGRIELFAQAHVINLFNQFQPFNPFTTEPVQGVHWEYGPNFGKALNRLAYTTPRQARISFGVRF